MGLGMGVGMSNGTVETPAAVARRAGRGAEELNEALGNRLEPRTRIVCVGGGTGLPVMLRGLARFAGPAQGLPGLELTAVVAMTDDGGSSGRLRRARGILPPGDVRNCLLALASCERPLREVFRYRFGGSGGLRGHSVGNLVLAALAEQRGDFLEAVRASSRLLATRGTVLPSTLTPVQLVATRDDGSMVVGERNLSRGTGRVRRVGLVPPSPPASDGLLEAISKADLVVIGPGSLYSSVLPNLLVAGVAEALHEARALRVLVSNLMTQPGETGGMSGEDHLDAVLEHAGPVVDAVLYNGVMPGPEVLARYERQGSHPVCVDRDALVSRGVIPLEADLVRQGDRVRHDSRKLGRCVVELARAGVQSD
ncbi:MAG: gluconeogenesis factor YvcK family protein [Myxococcaceae bacterium]